MIRRPNAQPAKTALAPGAPVDRPEHLDQTDRSDVGAVPELAERRWLAVYLGARTLVFGAGRVTVHRNTRGTLNPNAAIIGVARLAPAPRPGRSGRGVGPARATPARATPARATLARATPARATPARAAIPRR